MAGPSHPDAMKPQRPSPTRTAPPQTPASWPSHPRMRVYTLFGATGIVYLLMGLLVLRAIWSLGAGPEAWNGVIHGYANPIYVGWHALALVAVLFVGVRFFRLFPKAQPAHIGPLRPPPRPVIHAALYAAWIAVTILFVAVLAGGLFR
jgi:succinate dehydrogenase subunit C